MTSDVRTACTEVCAHGKKVTVHAVCVHTTFVYRLPTFVYRLHTARPFLTRKHTPLHIPSSHITPTWYIDSDFAVGGRVDGEGEDAAEGEGVEAEVSNHAARHLHIREGVERGLGHRVGKHNLSANHASRITQRGEDKGVCACTLIRRT